MIRAWLVIGLLGCGTPPPTWALDAGDCVAYEAPPPSALMSPKVSFSADVMPIFTGKCSSSICHGITDGPQGDLFLGAQLNKGSDAHDVYQGLVGQPSKQLPMMQFVKPGDPVQSYLMHKLDDDQCTFATTPGCMQGDKGDNGNCGARMPYQSALLPIDSRDTIRRWIAQGALEN